MRVIKELSPEKQWEIQQEECDRFRRGDILAAIVCFVVMAIVAVPRFNSWADAAIAWAWMGTPGFRFAQLPQGDERPLKRGDSVGAYEVSAPFLPCRDPSKGTQDCRTWEGRPRAHYGVDVALPIGTPLYVPSDGRATSAEVTCSTSPVGGNMALIELSRSNFSFRALHLDKCMPGTKKAGDMYALSGNTGYSTGPHLHWEEYRDEELLDPSFRYLEQTIVGAIK